MADTSTGTTGAIGTTSTDTSSWWNDFKISMNNDIVQDSGVPKWVLVGLVVGFLIGYYGLKNNWFGSGSTSKRR